MVKEKKQPHRVSDLFFYVRDNIDYLHEQLATRQLDEVERDIIRYQLEVLNQVKAICEKRNRY